MGSHGRVGELTGHSLLMTTLGPLDCLGAIEGGRTYDDPVPLSTEIDLDGRRFRILGLQTIVEQLSHVVLILRDSDELGSTRGHA
jgi:hypothetical protein